MMLLWELGNPSYAARTLGWDRVMRDNWWKQHKQSVSKYKATCSLHCRKHTSMLYRTWCRMVWIQRRGKAAAWLALTACLRNIRYHKSQLHFDQSDWFTLTVTYTCITWIIHGNIHGKHTHGAHKSVHTYNHIYRQKISETPGWTLHIVGALDLSKGIFWRTKSGPGGAKHLHKLCGVIPALLRTFRHLCISFSLETLCHLRISDPDILSSRILDACVAWWNAKHCCQWEHLQSNNI